MYPEGLTINAKLNNVMYETCKHDKSMKYSNSLSMYDQINK